MCLESTAAITTFFLTNKEIRNMYSFKRSIIRPPLLKMLVLLPWKKINSILKGKIRVATLGSTLKSCVTLCFAGGNQCKLLCAAPIQIFLFFNLVEDSVFEHKCIMYIASSNSPTAWFKGFTWCPWLFISKLLFPGY